MNALMKLAYPAALVIALTVPATAENYVGSWSIAQKDATTVQLVLQMSIQHGGSTGTWEESRTVSIASLGLTSGDLAGSSANRQFTIRRDAGDFVCQGSFANGHGGGTFTFAPSAGFRNELVRRGVGAPDTKQQFEFAMGDFKLATLDELAFVRSMHAAGYNVGTIANLDRLADHGVSRKYVDALVAAGLKNLSADDLVKASDQGISPDFIAGARKAFGSLSLDQLIRLRDHGVSSHYVASLNAIGYHPSIDDLIRLADNGVSADFIQRLRHHGYTHLSVDDIIRLRDAGI
jgi:hypothetical protein